MEDLSPIDAFRLITAPDPTDRVMAASRLEAKARLRFGVAQALVQGRIGFHYQPVVRAANPRMPAFFEMLARLRLPDGADPARRAPSCRRSRPGRSAGRSTGWRWSRR